MSSYVGKFFKNTDVQKMLQHTLLFLGNSPKNAPALYSMLSHVDLGQGVFYPAGGIASVIRALVKLGTQAGVVFRTNSPVAKIVTEAGVAKGVTLADGSFIAADIVVSNADLHHTDTQLLDAADRERTEQYWSKRVMSPSAFILYLGLNQQFPSVTHHNLVFCKDWDQNFKDIFDAPKLPSDPSFYVCVPSKTDPTVAPSGSENMFVLVPIASGLKLSEAELDSYEDQLLQTMESSLGLKDLRQAIVYKRRFCLDDFSLRYNSYRGSGLGLSHTMLQTAIFRPNTYSKKVKNLFFVGGNTNPGIGMPMCLVSAELVYKRLQGDKSGQPLKSL
jgi:phytoene desaturase